MLRNPAGRQAAKRYKQIGQTRQTLTKRLYIITFLISFFVSCGPRSGVHREEAKEQIIDWEGNPEPKNVPLSYSDKGGQLFKQYCATCHSANTDKYIAGPGLKGVFDRLPNPDESYFINYTLRNDSMFRAGDPYTLKLKTENVNNKMPSFDGQLSDSDIREIIKFLANPH